MKQGICRHFVGTVLVLVALAVVTWWLLRPATRRELIRVYLAAFENEFLAVTECNAGETAVISPSGWYVAFVERKGKRGRQVWIRELTQGRSLALSGTEDVSEPFWSPDKKSLSFSAEKKLGRVDICASPTLSLCDVQQKTSAPVDITDETRSTGAVCPPCIRHWAETQCLFCNRRWH